MKNIRDAVLIELQKYQESGEFVSGQDLAERCDVTRTTVWKVINDLRDEGCSIEAISNRGYRLLADNSFDKRNILKYLDKSTGAKVMFFNTIDSTNSEAKRLLIQEGYKKLHKTVIASSYQTDGKGRQGRHFYSPVNTGVYFSIIYSSPAITDPAIITASTAVAINHAIKQIFDVDTQIKWINDIYIKNKKIAGVLTEGITDLESRKVEAIIIGIGINVTLSNDMPPSVKKNAGSILKDSQTVKRSQLCAASVNEVIRILEGGDKVIKETLKEYKELSNILGKEIEVTPLDGEKSQKYKCTAVDITDNAQLKVLLPDGSSRLLSSGEVTLHK